MNWPQRKTPSPLAARRRSLPRERPPVEIPGWVPAKLHLEYMLRAERDGEEAAASWARNAKRALAR